MQSVCTLLPNEFAKRIVEARAIAAEETPIGAIYDPPFAHFTQQLAEEYDWDRLSAALADFAAREQPFEARTMGLWVSKFGDSRDLAVIPYASDEMRAFHERLWSVMTPFATGKIIDFCAPEHWFPHVTIKRCGTDRAAFANAMRRLADLDFAWTFVVDNVSVQHDPGKNSRTHYLRMRFPLGGQPVGPVGASGANATVMRWSEMNDSDSVPVWTAEIELDAGGRIQQRWTASERARLMASVQCSDVHFEGARCHVEDGRVATLSPSTPHPLVA